MHRSAPEPAEAASAMSSSHLSIGAFYAPFLSMELKSMKNLDTLDGLNLSLSVSLLTPLLMMGNFSVVPAEKQSFILLLILLLILMFIYIEKERYIQNLLVLHRKVFNKDTTIVGVEFMEQTYKGNVCFCLFLLLPGFLPPVLLVCCMMQRYCETIFLV